MLLCFGAAWPVSIYRSYKARTTAGKSVVFLLIVLAGYVSGVIHKLLYSRDFVIWFYVANGTLVLVDILVYFRNAAIEASVPRIKPGAQPVD